MCIHRRTKDYTGINPQLLRFVAMTMRQLATLLDDEAEKATKSKAKGAKR